MRRKHNRADTIAARRRHRTAVIPEPYRWLYALASHDTHGTELLGILLRARTVESVQSEPDGWVMLDMYVELLARLIDFQRRQRNGTN